MSPLQPIMSDRASGGTGGYTPALRAGDFVFVSGQGPLDPQTLAVLGDTVGEQTTHTLRNVLALVEAGGGDAGSIVRCTCYLSSIDLFDEFTAAYERFFAQRAPADPNDDRVRALRHPGRDRLRRLHPAAVGWLSRRAHRRSGSRRMPMTWSSSRARSSRTGARTGRPEARRPPARPSSRTTSKSSAWSPMCSSRTRSRARPSIPPGGRAVTTPDGRTSSRGCKGTGGGRSLLFSGHVDVVPAHGEGAHSYWDGEVEDGRLYGRGALDMKGGVACYLHALRCLIECGPGAGRRSDRRDDRR